MNLFFTSRRLRTLLTLLIPFYILAGIPTTPFHADEADHLFKARDYAIYFVIGDPSRMRVDPPVTIDSESHIRLLTGTTSAYLTGLILWHSGCCDLERWPPPWYYPDSPATNRAAGRMPAFSVLWRGRLASTFLTMIAALLMLRIGERLAGKTAGLAAALIFGLHPVVLLNGRRVMQEGALMCFTLLLLWLMLHKERNKSFSLWGKDLGWGKIGIVTALAIAAKPTALIAIAGIVTGKITGSSRPRREIGFWIIVALFAALIYILLTPAIWSNPVGRTLLAARLRNDVLQGQTAASQDAHHNFSERITAMITMAFPDEVQFYESPDFAADVMLAEEIRRYQKTPWRGMMIPYPIAFVLALTGGLWLLKRGRVDHAAGVTLIWGVITGIGILLAVPLGWQRYYLLWTLVMILLAGIGLGRFIDSALATLTPDT